MSTDTYRFSVAADGEAHIQLTITALRDGVAIDFSPTLVLHGLSDVYATDQLRGLNDPPSARGLAREHVRGMDLLSEDGNSATFRVELDPSWVEEIGEAEWDSTAYAADFPTAVSVATNDKQNQLLIAWSTWPGGPGYAALHSLGKRGQLGKRKAILNHHGLAAVASDAKGWYTAGNKTVKVWSKGGKLKKSIDHTATITTMVGTPSGPVIGFDDGRVARLGGDTMFQGASSVTSLASAGDDVAVGFADGTVWTKAGLVELDEQPVDDVALHPTGPWAAIAGGKLHRGQGTSASPPVVEQQTCNRTCRYAANDGPLVARAETQNSISAFDLRSPTRVSFLGLQSCFAVGRRGDVVWAGTETSIRVWRGGQPVAEASGNFKLDMYQIAAEASPDGKWLVVGRPDHPADLFELSSGRRLELSPPDACASCTFHRMCWIDDDRFLVLFNPGMKLFVYSVSEGTFHPPPLEVDGVNLDVFDHRVAVVSPFMGEGELHVVVDGEVVATHAKPEGHYNVVGASTTGAVVLDDSSDDGACMLLRPGQPTTTLHQRSLEQKPQFSPSGRWMVLTSLAASFDDRKLQLWNAEAGTLDNEISLALRADHVAIDDDGTVRGGISDEKSGIFTLTPGASELATEWLDPIDVTYDFVSVVAGDHGWRATTSQDPHRRRIVALLSGKLLRLGTRVDSPGPVLDKPLVD